jgi:hypothetical protein
MLSPAMTGHVAKSIEWMFVGIFMSGSWLQIISKPLVISIYLATLLACMAGEKRLCNAPLCQDTLRTKISYVLPSF